MGYINSLSAEFDFKIIKKYLDGNKVCHEVDYLLKYETYFKMGGRAKLYIMPTSRNDFIKLITFLSGQAVEYKIIGLATNIFFLDELDYGVIITTKYLTSVSIDEEYLKVDCGYALQDLVRVALINGSSGFEGLEGIPGSVGGAVVMNAGAYDYTISDKLVCVEYLSPEGKIKQLVKEECQFIHRGSIFRNQSDYVVLSALFKLTPGVRSEISKKIETYHIARHSYQEFSYPNLGSLFSVKGDFYREILRNDKLYSIAYFVLKVLYKNPIMKFFMRKNPNNKVFNWLIQRHKLFNITKYECSPKSMNILVNNGHASLEDILDYIITIRRYLKQDTPIENEIVIYPVLSDCSELNKVLDKIKASGIVL